MTVGFWSQQVESSQPPVQGGAGDATPPVPPVNSISVDTPTTRTVGVPFDLTGTYVDIYNGGGLEEIDGLDVFRSDDGGSTFNPTPIISNHLESLGAGEFAITITLAAPADTDIVLKVKDASLGNSPLAEDDTAQFILLGEPNTITVGAIATPQITGDSLSVPITYTETAEPINRVKILRSDDGGSTFPRAITDDNVTFEALFNGTLDAERRVESVTGNLITQGNSPTFDNSSFPQLGNIVSNLTSANYFEYTEPAAGDILPRGNNPWTIEAYLQDPNNFSTSGLSIFDGANSILAFVRSGGGSNALLLTGLDVPTAVFKTADVNALNHWMLSYDGVSTIKLYHGGIAGATASASLPAGITRANALKIRVGNDAGAWKADALRVWSEEKDLAYAAAQQAKIATGPDSVTWPVSGGTAAIPTTVRSPLDTDIVYKVIDATAGNSPLAEDDSNQFEIKAPPLPNSIVITPSVPSTLIVGEPVTVAGTYIDETDNIIKLDLLRSDDGGSTFPTTVVSSHTIDPPGDGTFSIPFTVAGPADTDIVYKVVDVTAHAGPKVEDVTGLTEIKFPNSIAITTQPASTQIISFAYVIEGTYTDAVDNITQLDLLRSDDGGSTFPTTVVSGHVVDPPGDGNYSIPYTATGPAGATVVLKVVDSSVHGGPKVEIESNQFEIILALRGYVAVGFE